MTDAEHEAILEAVANAVVTCDTLKVLRLALRVEAANLIRREVKRLLAERPIQPDLATVKAAGHRFTIASQADGATE